MKWYQVFDEHEQITHIHMGKVTIGQIKLYYKYRWGMEPETI